MGPFRFGIARAIGVIFLLAMAFAGLRSGSNDWYKTIYTLTVAILLYAAIAARYRGAYWYGFAVAGWAYFALALGPKVGAPPQLENRNLITSVVPELVGIAIARSEPPPTPANLQAVAMKFKLLRSNRAGICHSALALLFASVGGLVAARMARSSPLCPATQHDRSPDPGPREANP